MPFAYVNGIKLYYEVYGSGFPLLMIMGLGGNVLWWDPLILNEFSKHFKVVVFDNRGSGRSDKPDGEYSIKIFADDTVELMNSLGINRAHILGISMGGMIAQEIALSYPERVEKLVLVVTHPGGTLAVPPREEAIRFFTMDRSKMSAEEIARETLKVLHPPEYLEKHRDVVEKIIKRYSTYQTPPEIYAKQLQALLNFDATERLKNLKHPTLIVGAGKDLIVPPENSKILAQLIPNSRLVIFEDAGHALLGQKREEFIKIVLEFLKN
ncbi:MAG: alpha/beta fold hydrolase [Archaeoglobales archaeon]|nr:alpha/beta fold hydrolase [Archaeoglobales archaeon]